MRGESHALGIGPSKPRSVKLHERYPHAARLVVGAAVVTVCAGLIWLAAEGLSIPILGLTTDDVRAMAEAWSPWSALVSIGLMVLHSFLPLPAELIAAANGMMFGVPGGVAVTWLGAMLGAALSYAIARYLGQPAVQWLAPSGFWRRVESFEPGTGALLLVRLIPVISFNLINFAAGLVRVDWWKFLWTTGVGILPLTIICVLIGDQVLELSMVEAGGATAAAVMLLLMLRIGAAQRLVNGFSRKAIDKVRRFCTRYRERMYDERTE